jgi:geranylgeranyl diphosphate synthase type I
VEPKPFAGYRPILVEQLRRVLAGGGPLRSVLRYHVGLEDASGAPTEALGKLIRPSLTLLVAGELGGDPRAAVPAAAALELVHEFSLIHDDVQDRDEVRRGRPTVRRRWGEAQAINAGDLMLVFALAEAGRAGDAVRERVLGATVEMIEGQTLDVSFDGLTSLEEYTDLIDRKTGALFRCACELGGIVAGASPEVRERLDGIGRELGRAYQIRDDLLDGLLPQKTSYPVVTAMEKTDGANAVNAHIENVLREVERLPFGERGLGEIRALCDSLRVVDKGAER